MNNATRTTCIALVAAVVVCFAYWALSSEARNAPGPIPRDVENEPHETDGRPVLARADMPNDGREGLGAAEVEPPSIDADDEGGTDRSEGMVEAPSYIRVDERLLGVDPAKLNANEIVEALIQKYDLSPERLGRLARDRYIMFSVEYQLERLEIDEQERDKASRVRAIVDEFSGYTDTLVDTLQSLVEAETAQHYAEGRYVAVQADAPPTSRGRPGSLSYSFYFFADPWYVELSHDYSDHTAIVETVRELERAHTSMTDLLDHIE